MLVYIYIHEGILFLGLVLAENPNTDGNDIY